MQTLITFGWNEYHSKNTSITIDANLVAGRVVTLKGFQYEVITPRGFTDAELSGKLLYGSSPEDLPKVGDWVTLMDYGTNGYIIDLLPRINALSRKDPGLRSGVQVLAANIDTALIVQGLDRDFNLMRLERYIVQVLSCGIEPVVVLAKADLIADPTPYLGDVARLSRDCRVCVCSTYSRQGIDVILSDVLRPEKTYILVGSSGAGKSSLLNAIGAPPRVTGATSDSTGKGKHTTTTRDLFLLANGSLVIDTPGMREFGVTANDADSADLFPAIEKLAGGCRFTDCTHMSEDGCAVLEAIHNGELDGVIYESYVKLVRERQRFLIAAEDKKKEAKRFGRMTREAKAFRKKFKY